MESKALKIIKLKQHFAHLKTLNQQRIKLMEELKTSSIFELCDYDLRVNPDRKNNYFLFHIETKTMVADGTSARIKKWIDIREDVNPNCVFNIELIY